ncbi:hypothetical protein FGO68_gene8770 [Halteria grandinella]|uniref:Uncharacterized protein n=1 Tax=Halteria grandinella TaxID=5974 RepID=A0A8J8NAU0_HALGN|nr:hypothetical protein FGO68_gene8770 [Halteria grandinella]
MSKQHGYAGPKWSSEKIPFSDVSMSVRFFVFLIIQSYDHILTSLQSNKTGIHAFDFWGERRRRKKPRCPPPDPFPGSMNFGTGHPGRFMVIVLIRLVLFVPKVRASSIRFGRSIETYLTTNIRKGCSPAVSFTHSW